MDVKKILDSMRDVPISNYMNESVEDKNAPIAKTQSLTSLSKFTLGNSDEAITTSGKNYSDSQHHQHNHVVNEQQGGFSFNDLVNSPQPQVQQPVSTISTSQSSNYLESIVPDYSNMEGLLEKDDEVDFPDMEEEEKDESKEEKMNTPKDDDSKEEPVEQEEVEDEKPKEETVEEPDEKDDSVEEEPTETDLSDDVDDNIDEEEEEEDLSETPEEKRNKKELFSVYSELLSHSTKLYDTVESFKFRDELIEKNTYETFSYIRKKVGESNEQINDLLLNNFTDLPYDELIYVYGQMKEKVTLLANMFVTLFNTKKSKK